MEIEELKKELKALKEEAFSFHVENTEGSQRLLSDWNVSDDLMDDTSRNEYGWTPVQLMFLDSATSLTGAAGEVARIFNERCALMLGLARLGKNDAFFKDYYTSSKVVPSIVGHVRGDVRNYVVEREPRVTYDAQEHIETIISPREVTPIEEIDNAVKERILENSKEAVDASLEYIRQAIDAVRLSIQYQIFMERHRLESEIALYQRRMVNEQLSHEKFHEHVVARARNMLKITQALQIRIKNMEQKGKIALLPELSLQPI